MRSGRRQNRAYGSSAARSERAVRNEVSDYEKPWLFKEQTSEFERARKGAGLPAKILADEGRPRVEWETFPDAVRIVLRRQSCGFPEPPLAGVRDAASP